MKLEATITDKEIGKLPLPAEGMVYAMDSKVIGLGVRMTAGGSRTYVLRYRNKSGVSRVYKIGRHPDWGIKAARLEAKRLKQLVDQGDDPHGEDKAVREAPTVKDLCERYMAERMPDKRSKADDRSMIENDIIPNLGSKKVAEVEFGDIRAHHQKITTGEGRKVAVGGERRRSDRSAPYRANRVVALLSTMFGLAIKQWKMRPDKTNPTDGIKRNIEVKRKRYAKPEELARLTEALAAHPDQREADLVRLLLLTGCRLGEALNMRWDQLDLESGIWRKPGSTTKQVTEHEVTLSAAAVKLLDEIEGNDDYVFPSPVTGLPRADDFKKPWRAITRAAGIRGLRLHDLRHTAASYLVSTGHSLPMIGSILGHSNTATTSRYAHLMADPQRAAVNALADIVTGKPSAELKSLNSKG